MKKQIFIFLILLTMFFVFSCDQKCEEVFQIQQDLKSTVSLMSELKLCDENCNSFFKAQEDSFIQLEFADKFELKETFAKVENLWDAKLELKIAEQNLIITREKYQRLGDAFYELRNKTKKENNALYNYCEGSLPIDFRQAEVNFRNAQQTIEILKQRTGIIKK